jgi:hypothetical protein
MQRTGRVSRIGNFIQILEASVGEKILRLVKSRAYQIKILGPHKPEFVWYNHTSEDFPYSYYAIWGNADSEHVGITELPHSESSATSRFLEMVQSATFLNFQTKTSETKEEH